MRTYSIWIVSLLSIASCQGGVGEEAQTVFGSGAGSGSGQPDAGLPDTSRLDTGLPDTSLPDATLPEGGCVLTCDSADLDVVGRADTYAEPDYAGPWDINDCSAVDSATCVGELEITCAPVCPYVATESTVLAQPKAEPFDLGDVKDDPKSVIAIINLGTKEISGVIEYQKKKDDKVQKMDFKVAAGKAAQIAIGENAKDYASVKVTVVEPKGQLYKQVDWVTKPCKWKIGGTDKTGDLPILPVYSKDP